MLKRVLILLIAALSQVGWASEEGIGLYEPYPLTPEGRQSLERLKREFLQLEDLKIGDGPVAALGRKVTADIEVHYPDGTLVYRGPATSYFGMEGYVFIHDSVVEDGLLNSQQRGIMLGLNGMTVGGKRRITIHPKLVCEWPGKEEANPNAACHLVYRSRLWGRSVTVRKEQLIVEAKLTASCIPIHLDIPFISSKQIWCRNSDVPQHDPSAPIWRIYEAPPRSP